MRKINLSIVFSFIISCSVFGQITDLQDQFRKLGGIIVFNESTSISEYSYSGRSETPLEVAEILKSLRNVHLKEAEESIHRKQYDRHFFSAISANRVGRDLLQLERDNISLLDFSSRHSINNFLREFYDKEIDLYWLLLEDDLSGDIEIIDAMFRTSELSRARDFIGSVYRRMDLSSRPEAEKAFSKFEAYLGYQEALTAIQNYQADGKQSNIHLSALKESIKMRAEKLDINNLKQVDAPGMGDTGVINAASRANFLGIGEAMIMYHMTKTNVYTFVLINNAPSRFIRLPVDTEKLREYIQTYYEQLSSKPAGRGAIPVSGFTNNSWRDTGQKLYDVLFAPIAQYLEGVDRLNIVPHDYIHLVPFAALPNSERSKTFLVDRYTIVISPTPMFAGWNGMRRRDPEKLAMIVGINEFSLTNNLKFAEEEAISIADVIGKSDLLLGSRGQATYQNIIDNLEKYWIVHIASHGAYIPYAPSTSHVILQGQGQQKDEPLMAIDVIGKHLNASLIVLSACNTATSNTKGLPPDGDILGLPRSFLIAGAERVIASLWAVNDRATKEFFENYYKKAFSGSAGGVSMLIPKVDMDVALALTQRQIKSKYPHPYYWAPFILIGVP